MQHILATVRISIQKRIDVCNDELTSLINNFASNKEIMAKRRELLSLYTKRRLLEEKEE